MTLTIYKKYMRNNFQSISFIRENQSVLLEKTKKFSCELENNIFRSFVDLGYPFLQHLSLLSLLNLLILL
jgi:hypothetical protein